MIISIFIFIIVAIPFVIALFKSNEFKLEKEITINKPKQAVFDYIKHLKNQDNFTVWTQQDPGMKREYNGTDGTIGFVSAWESNHKKVGTGKQTIMGINEGHRLDTQIHFMKPWDNIANAYFITETTGANQTKVQWGYYNTVKYPMKVAMIFMNMEKMIGKDFQTGLEKLKEILEK